MSQSFKHVSITGNAGASDKVSKQLANRRESCTVRRILRTETIDIIVLPTKREMRKSKTFHKNSKHWMDLKAKPHLKKYLRK